MTTNILSALAGILLGCFILWVRLHPRLRCACNHPHILMKPHHERLAVMVVAMVWNLAAVGFMVYGAHRAPAIFMLLLAWFEGYRIWVHEKGRRRRAARVIGRVMKDLNGRLKVVPA